jgi:hypothetical protein
LPKRLSIKLKCRLPPSGERIATLPSERHTKELEKALSPKSLAGRNPSNSQSQGRIDRLPTLQLERSRLRHLSTERREEAESGMPKELDIIRELRRKCQLKQKLKKVNSSAECKREEGREAEAFASHLRKMSKKSMKKHSGEESRQQYRSELQAELEQHRSIHLKKKGKSYKAKVFI